MDRTTLRAKGQLTLPTTIREAANLEEGDPIDVELTDEGILLRPRKVIDATQAWFWSPEWQRGEREASDEITAGKTTRHGSDKDFLAALDTPPASRSRKAHKRV